MLHWNGFTKLHRLVSDDIPVKLEADFRIVLVTVSALHFCR